MKTRNKKQDTRFILHTKLDQYKPAMEIELWRDGEGESMMILMRFASPLPYMGGQCRGKTVRKSSQNGVKWRENGAKIGCKMESNKRVGRRTLAPVAEHQRNGSDRHRHHEDLQNPSSFIQNSSF